MGFLVRMKLAEDAGVLRAMWEAFQIGSRPKSVREIRAALSIQEKLETISKDVLADTAMECPDCHKRSPIDHVPLFNFWRVPSVRELAGDCAVFFEDEQFAQLKDVLTQAQPPQPRVRDFARMWDIIEDAEKNWKGEEVKLRERHDPPKTAEPAVQEAAAPAGI